jgi:epoxyqueuosine reductase QueG
LAAKQRQEFVKGMAKTDFPDWLVDWMQAHKVRLWGAADLSDFKTPSDKNGLGFPMAIAWACPMPPQVMASIQEGPNQAYADAYAAVNTRINTLASALSRALSERGWRALPLAASERTDKENIKGDFPHKTAATRAGLGWIGRHCQLVTRKYGPWVRLGTVFTDMPLPCGPVLDRSFCGKCNQCVDACPAGALSGEAWRVGVARENILDVQRCDLWKKKNYFEFHKGHNCGICASVCPYGLKRL